MSRQQRFTGFTFIEMIVIVTIIVALSGVLVPVVSNELSDSKLQKAHDTVNRIATAIENYVKDTGFAPTGKNGRREMHWLYSMGQVPAGNSFSSNGAGASLADFLTVNGSETKDWQGPYLAALGADPWGSAYVVNTSGFFADGQRTWILSAGKNRVLETSTTASVPGGDDVGLVLP